jgi:flavin reductase (DIM6/NTAB) family NADH-FMN oxidoreductase RutF
MTANSFTSVSMDPPLLLFCVQTTPQLGALPRLGVFAIHAQLEQRHLSSQFARRQRTSSRVWRSPRMMTECRQSRACSFVSRAGLSSYVEGDQRSSLAG